MATNQQELDLNAMFNQLKSALAEKKEKKSASKKDVTKAITLFKKSKASFENAITSLEVAIGLLEGNDASDDNTTKEEDNTNRSPEYLANVEKYPEAPYGRKTNGEPKKPAGRAAAKLKAQGADMFEGDNNSSDEAAGDDKPTKPAASTKGAKAPAKAKTDANAEANEKIRELENA